MFIQYNTILHSIIIDKTLICFDRELVDSLELLAFPASRDTEWVSAEKFCVSLFASVQKYTNLTFEYVCRDTQVLMELKERTELLVLRYSNMMTVKLKTDFQITKTLSFESKHTVFYCIAQRICKCVLTGRYHPMMCTRAAWYWLAKIVLCNKIILKISYNHIKIYSENERCITNTKKTSLFSVWHCLCYLLLPQNFDYT